MKIDKFEDNEAGNFSTPFIQLYQVPAINATNAINAINPINSTDEINHSNV